MLSDTLSEGLEAYRIGPKIRALRQEKSIGLVQLGEHTGLSPGMLSKIERGQVFPTLPTLLRIALVFGVGLEHFFIDDERPTIAVVRKADRLRLPNAAGDKSPAYFFESLDYPATDRKMEAYYAQFETAGEGSEPHSHVGAEIIYVISGQLILTIDDNETVLDEGDSIYFDSSYPHSYRRGGNSVCSAVVVVAR